MECSTILNTTHVVTGAMAAEGIVGKRAHFLRIGPSDPFDIQVVCYK
jgi:hypothetical protein